MYLKFNFLKYCIILLFLSCTNNSQNIEEKIYEKNVILFDAVSKKIEFDQFEKTESNLIGEALLLEWFNEQIKTNGFNGSLEINVTALQTVIEKKDRYFNITVDLDIDFTLSNTNLDSTKNYSIKLSEFSEISGDFSISDQENLIRNTFNEAINKITIKISSLI